MRAGAVEIVAEMSIIDELIRLSFDFLGYLILLFVSLSSFCLGGRCKLPCVRFIS